MRATDTHLCCFCRKILSGAGLEVLPIQETADEPRQCPWCQRNKAYSKYSLHVPSEK